VRTEEVVFQGAAVHVLVDEEPLVAVGAVTDDVDEVLLVELAELGDLGQELDVALEAMLVHLLDGHGLNAQTNESASGCAFWLASRAMHISNDGQNNGDGVYLSVLL
jgi:hypothetical protein